MSEFLPGRPDLSPKFRAPEYAEPPVYGYEPVLDDSFALLAQLQNAQSHNGRLQREAEQYRNMAVTDELTGLANRRGFNYELTRIFTEEQGSSYFVVFIDLDNFKEVNDTRGYDVGDEALKRVCEYVHDTIRYTDFCARYGGDELVILVKDDADGDTVYAEEIVEDFLDRLEEDVASYAVGELGLPDFGFTSGIDKFTVTDTTGVPVVIEGIQRAKDILQMEKRGKKEEFGSYR